MAVNTELPTLSHDEIVGVFNDFDTDHSGDISLDEFERGIKRLQLPLSQTDIINVLHLVDTNHDGTISLNEFTAFCMNQDSKIRTTFSALDINKDHSLSPSEIRSVLRSQLNLELSMHEMTHFMEQFSKREGATEILFQEFRDRLLLVPAMNIRRFYEVHRPAMAIDIGESFVVPPEDGEDDDGDTEYSKLNVFISGGICGAISRTMTAPMDRVKVLFQSGALDESASILDTVRNIWNEGGLRSFWRGNGANIIKIAPESACKFMAYDILKTNRTMATQSAEMKCQSCRLMKPTSDMKATPSYMYVTNSRDQVTVSGDPCVCTITIEAVAFRGSSCRVSWDQQIAAFKKQGGLALMAGSKAYRDFLNRYPSIRNRHRLGHGKDRWGYPSLFDDETARSVPFHGGKQRQLHLDDSCSDAMVPRSDQKSKSNDNVDAGDPDIDMDRDEEKKYDSGGCRFTVPEVDTFLNWLTANPGSCAVNKKEYFRDNGLSEYMRDHSHYYRAPESYYRLLRFILSSNC